MWCSGFQILQKEGSTVDFIGVVIIVFPQGAPAKAGWPQIKAGAAPVPKPVTPGRIPRISKLMALAIHFDGLIRNGHVADYADLARLGHVTRARITQIMNLLNLSPDIQEDILFLPHVFAGKDAITEHQVREIAGEVGWGEQRGIWKENVFADSHV